jgi:hypothetical protein
MSSLVRELQHDALQVSIPVSSLLRKALVVARKLSIEDFRTWCDQELNGYEDGGKYPDYRYLTTELKAQNPALGLIPVIQPPEMAKTFSRKAIGTPIAELEDLTANRDSKGIMTLSIPKDLEAILVRMLDGMYPVMVINRSELMGILDAVRNLILEWALKLEEQGILGEEMVFSDNEKRIAPSVTYNIGQMIHSQIQHETSASTQNMVVHNFDTTQLNAFVRDLRDSLDSLKLTGDDKAQLATDIQTIEVQAKSRKPKSAIIRECLTSVRNILEGAAGSIVAVRLLEQLPRILSIFSAQ